MSGSSLETVRHHVRGVCCELCLKYTVLGTVWKMRNPNNPQQPWWLCDECRARVNNATAEHVDERA